ncbi:MAG: transporter substrate-binding domain-containing protein, partial [Spirochaetales bacterium]|nr:transporter substrate-binding domain-containing protein [Spirochaetales bacterium]
YMPFFSQEPVPAKLDIPELFVGVTPSSPPLIYKEGERIVGLEVDLATALGESLGMPVRFVELDWQDQIPALEKGKIDIIMSGMSITQTRSYRIDFCDPYFRSGQMMLVDIANANQYPRGYYDLKWKKDIRIGVVDATTGDYFARKNLPKALLKGYTTTDQAVNGLIRGNIDAFIGDAPMIAYAASMNESRGVVPIYTLLTEEYLAWGVRKEDKALQRRANEFFKEYKKDGRLESILRKWVPYLN